MTEESSSESSISFLAHLRELRGRLFYCLFALLITTGLGLFFSQWSFDFLMSAIPPEVERINIVLTGHFFLTMKLAFYFGIFAALPVFTWHVYSFVKPALEKDEDRFAISFIFSGWLLLGGAIYFTHKALPLMVQALLSSAWSFEGVENKANIIDYGSDLLTIYMGFSIMFQIPLIIFMLIFFGFLEASFYSKYRKIVIVLLMTLCAIFTPPDVLSLVIVFCPVYFLLELSVFLGRHLRRKD